MMKKELWPIKEVDPEDYPDSPLNDHPPLTDAELSKLEKSILKVGSNTNPIIIYQGKVIAGKHRRKVCLKNKMKVRAIFAPDHFSREEALNILDQDNFLGRDWTVEKRDDMLEKRFGKIIMETNLSGQNISGKSLEFDGKKYTNVAVYISERSGLTLDIVKKSISRIKSKHNIKKKLPKHLDLEPVLQRQASSKYKELVKHEEKIDELKGWFKDNIPGGLARIRREKERWDKLKSKLKK